MRMDRGVGKTDRRILALGMDGRVGGWMDE